MERPFGFYTALTDAVQLLRTMHEEKKPTTWERISKNKTLRIHAYDFFQELFPTEHPFLEEDDDYFKKLPETEALRNKIEWHSVKCTPTENAKDISTFGVYALAHLKYYEEEKAKIGERPYVKFSPTELTKLAATWAIKAEHITEELKARGVIEIEKQYIVVRQHHFEKLRKLEDELIDDVLPRKIFE